MKIEKAYFSLLIAMALLTIVTISAAMQKETIITLNGKTISEASAFEGDIVDFYILANRFAENHNFTKDIYDCENYSRDLKAIADQLGFKTELATGCERLTGDNRSCHMWLQLIVDFEPQRAGFTDYSKKYPYKPKQ